MPSGPLRTDGAKPLLGVQGMEPPDALEFLAIQNLQISICTAPIGLFCWKIDSLSHAHSILRSSDKFIELIVVLGATSLFIDNVQGIGAHGRSLELETFKVAVTSDRNCMFHLENNTSPIKSLVSVVKTIS